MLPAAGVLSAALLAATPSATADRADDDTHDRHDDDRAAAADDHDDHDDDHHHDDDTDPDVPRPTTIAAGVTVGGEVLVGGLSPAEATDAVKAFFARPLTLKLRHGHAARDPEAARRLRVRRRRDSPRPHRAPRARTCR